MTSSIGKRTEWTGSDVRLVQLTRLPRSQRGYGKRNAADISNVWVHQSAGNHKRGVEAALAIARFHTGEPIYKRDSAGNIVIRPSGKKAWIGGGRGWPGIGYTFVVPGVPELIGGKLEVYRVNDDDAHTYHTGAGANRTGVAVVFAGTFASRHLLDSELTRPGPTKNAMEAGQQLILEYLLPRYGLTVAEGLRGHFEAGKKACPGDALERWIISQRAEARGQTQPDTAWGAPDGLAFTVRGRQRALLELGFEIGPSGVDGVWGEHSKGALLAFQDAAGLVVDGRWGPRTEAAVEAALEEVRRL